MQCPRCKSTKVQPVAETLPKYYCVDCNYAWDAGNGGEEPKGTLDFTGAVTAKRVFEVLTQGQDFTPEFRAALETQITGIIFEQWFQGFKAGQMASILYAREHYGKNRDGSKTTVSKSDIRTGNSPSTDSRTRDGKERGVHSSGRRRRADGSLTGHSDSEIKKRINGVEFRHPRTVIVPENYERLIAETVGQIDKQLVDSVVYENGKIKLILNTRD